MNDATSKTDAASTEQVAERLCTSCGQGDLVGRNTVHDECLSTPYSRRLRSRVRAAAHEMIRPNQRMKFDRMLATVTNAQLDVWLDRAADAHVSGGEGDQSRAGIRKHADEFVADLILNTVDDPKPAKKKAAASA